MAAPSPNNNAGFANLDISLLSSIIGARNGFWPHTRAKVWNSFAFGSIGTKSIGNYKVSGRPPKGDAGGRAKL